MALCPVPDSSRLYPEEDKLEDQPLAVFSDSSILKLEDYKQYNQKKKKREVENQPEDKNRMEEKTQNQKISDQKNEECWRDRPSTGMTNVSYQRDGQKLSKKALAS